MKVALKCVYVCIEENQPLGNFQLLYTSFSVYIVLLVVGLHYQIVENPSLIFFRGHHIGCVCKTVTKVFSEFAERNSPLICFEFVWVFPI